MVLVVPPSIVEKLNLPPLNLFSRKIPGTSIGCCQLIKFWMLTLQACITRGFGHAKLVKGMLKGVAACTIQQKT